jgi:two-component system, LuxR family, response regulator FixJ
MSDKPTVYFVDDDESIRRTFPVAFESDQYRIKTFDCADAFLSEFDPSLPGCLVLDLRMPGMSGIALQQELISRGWTIPIIFFTGFGDIDIATQAMKLGAVYFFQKPADLNRLVESITEAIALDNQVRVRFERQSDLTQRLEKLTPRQHQVLQMIKDGLTSKQIATKLGRSIKTVEVHRSQVMKKLGARCVADLMRIILQVEAAVPE